MVNSEFFYQKGYQEFRLDKLNFSQDLIRNKFKEVISDKKHDSKWLYKYKNTKDFELQSILDEPFLFDLLFKNELDKKINSLVNKKVFLTNIQYRICYKGLSYMTWHRDTYINKSKIIGPFLPCYKFLVFPKLFEEDSKEFSIITETHSRLNFSFIDKYFSSFKLNKKSFFCGNEYGVLMDTTTLHKAEQSLKDIPRPRIIYNFATQETIDKFYQNERSKTFIDIHKKILN